MGTRHVSSVCARPILGSGWGVRVSKPGRPGQMDPPQLREDRMNMHEAYTTATIEVLQAYLAPELAQKLAREIQRRAQPALEAALAFLRPRTSSWSGRWTGWGGACGRCWTPRTSSRRKG